MNPHRFAFIAAFVALFFATSAAGQTASLAAGERRFLEDTARHGMAEIELGKLAQEKAQNADVKAFGKRMVDDHGKASEALKKLAAAKGVTLPAEVSGDHKRTHDGLAKMSGAAFDSTYMDNMLRDHEREVREFRTMARTAKDNDVKSFAASTLPTLEQHLQLAKTTTSRAGLSTSAGGRGMSSSGPTAGGSRNQQDTAVRK